MISVINWCHSRQAELDITLPLLLKQEGVEYEIIMVVGPDINTPEKFDHPVIKRVHDGQDASKGLNIAKAYNLGAKVASGDTLFLTQCDMQINSPTQLKRMYELLNGNNVVTEKFFKKGQRDPGTYLQCCMVRKEHYDKAGGIYEGYGYPADNAGHEDGDLMATWLEMGLDLDHTETDLDEGVYHIDHPMPDYLNDPDMKRKLENAKKIFWSRHKEGVLSLYGKQVARRLMARRMGNNG